LVKSDMAFRFAGFLFSISEHVQTVHIHVVIKSAMN